jgi:hypothetical protein
MLKGINWIGVGAAFVAATAIGMLWYGMLFEAQWMALSGITQADIDAANPAMSMTVGAVNTLIAMAGLGWLIARLGEDSWIGGLKTGLAVGVLFALTTAALGFIYGVQNRGLIPIDFGYLLLMYGVGGLLIGGLRLPLRRGAAAAA